MMKKIRKLFPVDQFLKIVTITVFYIMEVQYRSMVQQNLILKAY